jgi:hypothetical protein
MSTDPKVAANPSISDLGFSDIQTLEVRCWFHLVARVKTASQR